MLKVLVQNPLSKKYIKKNGNVHRRVNKLLGLHKLNTTKLRTTNPKKGKPILYNNFPLSDQQKLIKDFKKKMSDDAQKAIDTEAAEQRKAADLLHKFEKIRRLANDSAEQLKSMMKHNRTKVQ